MGQKMEYKLEIKTHISQRWDVWTELSAWLLCLFVLEFWVRLGIAFYVLDVAFISLAHIVLTALQSKWGEIDNEKSF